VLAVVSAIGPPITLTTALLIYFGWVRADAQARAMGLDVTLFGYTTQDLILFSLSHLFIPLVFAFAAGIGWLALDRWLLRRVRDAGTRGTVRRAAAAAAAAGCLRRRRRGRRRCLLSQPAASHSEHGQHRRAADHERGQQSRTLQSHTSSSPSTRQRCSLRNKPDKT
jgi:hypothetical protein